MTGRASLLLLLLLTACLVRASETAAPVDAAKEAEEAAHDDANEPVVQPSADWETLTKATYEQLANSTERWNVVFHDSNPRFRVLNDLAAWAKAEIKDKPFRFGHVNVEKETELATALEVDYVPLMITIVDGQVHDFYSYLNDEAQLKAWLQGGYVISSPFVGGEASDEDFSQEELEAMEKEIGEGEAFMDEDAAGATGAGEEQPAAAGEEKPDL